MLSQSLLALSAAGMAAAHYTLVYPEWRGDSLDSSTNYTQWERPCSGIAYGSGNRTDWPIDGGSLSLSLGHAFNYAFINLGLEVEGDIPTFNISLTPQPLNTTGDGTLCIRHLPINVDFDIPDGTNASIQVVKVGPSGNAMYNCADIRLTSSAEQLSEEECTNEDAQHYVIEDQEGFDTDGEGEDGDSAAAFTGASLTAAAGVAVAAILGMAL